LEISILKNTQANCFEAKSPDCHAIIKYHQNSGVIVFFHILAEHKPGCHILSEKLIEHVLAYAKENDLQIIPLCPQMKHYIRWHHPDYHCVGKVFIADK
jgi:predicted GNAT family acetyltransferase